jgi:hypothetical protein
MGNLPEVLGMPAAADAVISPSRNYPESCVLAA